MNTEEMLTIVREKRGRPSRTRIETRQTRFWAHVVSIMAQREVWDLEDVLGEDGKWEGLWSRYARGLVSPSKERLHRIDAVLPTSAMAFTCPIWNLVEDREYQSDELRMAALWLPEPHRSWFIPFGDSMYGRFWLSPDIGIKTVEMATTYFIEKHFNIGALTSLVLLVRVAEMRQDAQFYLEALRGLGRAVGQFRKSDFFKNFPPLPMRMIADPAYAQHFADTKLNKRFRQMLKSPLMEDVAPSLGMGMLDFFARVPEKKFKA